MAKYVPMDLLKSLSGKICSHSDTYFANRGETKYTGKICNPRTKPFTEAELARQQLFASAHAAVKALTAEEKTTYETAFKNQKKYSSLNGYMMAMEYAKLKAAQSENGEDND